MRAMGLAVGKSHTMLDFRDVSSFHIGYQRQLLMTRKKKVKVEALCLGVIGGWIS